MICQCWALTSRKACSTEAIERTARRLSRGAIRYALMDLRRLELPDESCRGVWCSASLLHLPRSAARRAARELARVTRSGGPLVILLKLRGEEQEAETFQTYQYASAEGLVDPRRFFAYYTTGRGGGAAARRRTGGARGDDLDR